MPIASARCTTPTAAYRSYVVNVTNGSVITEADYSALGVRTVKTGSEDAIPFSFAGGLYDADTALTRFGARDYDARFGRWTNKDPILFDGGQTNLYVYVGNDPVNRQDPSGLEETGAGGASSTGEGGSEGGGNTPCEGQEGPDPAYSRCVDQCMSSQGADIAAEIAATMLPFAPTPKTPWELSKTLGGGSSTTTWGSRAAAAMGLPARNGLRTASAVVAKASAFPFAAAGGYWLGSLMVCAASCE
jgi:RHS repeat-associated protein